MQFLDSFTEQNIHDILKRTFLYSDKSEISFFTEKYSSHENFTLLNVKGDGVERQFTLVKIPDNFKTEKQLQSKNSNVLYPVFIIEDNNKEIYGAFESQHELEQFVSPEENDIECLKIILKTLAEDQALNLAASKEIEKPSKYNLKDIADTVTSLDFFEELDEAVTKQSIENLQLDFNNLLEEFNLLVRSIGCPFARNVYINKDMNKSIFLSVSSTKMVPPVYDALLYVFALSNEKFRQKHFENLMVYYFESLNKLLQQLQSDVAAKINRIYNENQVKVLLPVVKFKIAHSLIKLEKSLKLQEILTNILYFIRYPLINQEDIYEVTKNKLESSNYDLLDYSLVSLNETNGHLGKYFHLDIKIKVEEKEKELQLFAKFMRTDVMKGFIESGPAKKEDFFYTTLFPLFTKHGLNSLLDFAPRCYLSRINKLLVLDDLSRQGYVGLKPNVVLDYNGLRASVENLAKFHACTIILEEILTEKSGKAVRLDEDYGEFLQEIILTSADDDNDKQNHDDPTLELFYYIFEKFPEVTEKLKLSSEEIRARFKKIYLSYAAKVKKSDAIRNVINHGDMYVANMLFKFDEDKLITSGILIDFQILCYLPPTHDLLFFLFENSTKETRDKYFKRLIEDYYQYVSENIRKFNFDPEVVFPKKLFDQNIKFMKSAEIIGAFNYVYMFHIDSDFREEIFQDMEKLNYYLMDHKCEIVDLSWKCEDYRNILKGLVEDIVDIIKEDF